MYSFKTAKKEIINGQRLNTISDYELFTACRMLVRRESGECLWRNLSLESRRVYEYIANRLARIMTAYAELGFGEFFLQAATSPEFPLVLFQLKLFDTRAKKKCEVNIPVHKELLPEMFFDYITPENEKGAA